MKLVSFSIYGPDPMYVAGGVRNAEMALEFYPGWHCRFYCAEDVPEAGVRALLERGAQVVMMPVPDYSIHPALGMFWRMLPATEADVEVLVVRDTDSRPTPRECAAVEEWLGSERKFHIMRDHPEHGVPMLGGMWGVKGGVPGLVEMIQEFLSQNRAVKGADQQFLAQYVYPIAASSAMVHDEVVFAETPYPAPRSGCEFVGMRVHEDDSPLQRDVDSMREYLESQRNVGPPSSPEHCGE